MVTPLIQLKNISKSFGPRVVLDDVSFDINKNAITAVIGKSGVGKSVLIKHIIGLVEPDAGEIVFDGKAYSKMSRKEFSEIKDRCSYMFQNNALFDSLTVFENIALPLREKSALDERAIQERVSFRIDQLDLGEVAGMYPKQISGGMQKRVALARALVTEPEIIFFDEPTTGLDPIRKNSVFSMIHHYHERLNFTAVIITHDVPDIFYIAHHVHILDDGKIIFSGTPVELEASDLRNLYLYTHGQDLLIDEITGLHNRMAIMQKFSEIQVDVNTCSLCYLFLLRIGGVQDALDFRGDIFIYSLVQNIAKFLRSFDGGPVFSGTFSKGTFLIFSYEEDKDVVMNVLREIKNYFGYGNVKKILDENNLFLEIGVVVINSEDDVRAAVKNALRTVKKLT